jgi:GxxExxY protein
MHDEHSRGYGDGGGGGGHGGGYDRGRGGGPGGGGRRGGGGHDRHGGGGRFERGHDEDGRGLPLSELDPALTEVSRKVIGCAIEVHKGLGPGYDEEVYRKALGVELQAAGVSFETQRAFPVTYRGQAVGNKVADLYVDSRFVVEVLAHRGEVGAGERAGVRALLRAGDMELGLIINFAERRLKDGLVRVLNPEKLGLNQPPEGGPVGDGPSGGAEQA